MSTKVTLVDKVVLFVRYYEGNYFNLFRNYVNYTEYKCLSFDWN